MYAVARAPGFFGRYTEVLSVHRSWAEALAARGFTGGRANEWAIYDVHDGCEPGQTLWSDMMPRRLDRDPKDVPDNSPYSTYRRWKNGSGIEMGGWRWYVTRYGIAIVAGPFKAEREAEHERDKLTAVWRASWLKKQHR